MTNARRNYYYKIFVVSNIIILNKLLNVSDKSLRLIFNEPYALNII